MTIDERNILVEKAKTRKNGIYKFREYLYVVKDHGLVAFADYFGYCYSCHNMFNVKIGECKSYERKQSLKTYLNSL